MLVLSKKNSWTCFTAFLIVLLGIFFHWESIQEQPSFIHARAQIDRFSLALNFFHNGFNPFKAETYLLNTEFPYNFKVPKGGSVVTVDFPIHDFLIALVMKLVGSKSVFIFRAYTLIYSFVGLYFLYKIGGLLKLKNAYSLLTVLFVATSPVYVFYQDGFLPSIPSLSNAIIGIFFYLKFLNTSKKSAYKFSLLFLVLAAINRSIYVIPLVAVIGVEVLSFLILFFRKQQQSKKLFLWTISASIIALIPLILQYFRNSQYMVGEYGSVFLYYLVPAGSLEEAWNIINQTLERWKFDFLTPAHYLLLVLLCVDCLVVLFKNRWKFTFYGQKLSLLIVVSFIGYLLFSVAMLRKFPDHDYYFIDTFLFLIILFLINSLKTIQERVSNSKWLRIVILLVFFIPALVFAYNNFKERRTEKSWEKIPKNTRALSGIEQVLSDLKIPKDAKILVVGPTAPNLPLLLMDRKGYALMHKSKEDIKTAFNWDIDFVLLLNKVYLEEFAMQYPEFLHHLEKLYDNGKFTLARKRKSAKKIKPKDFFDLDLGVEQKKINIRFKENLPSEWTNNFLSTKHSLEGNSHGTTSTKSDYGLTYKSNNLPFFRKSAVNLEVKSNILFEKKLAKASIVTALKNKDKTIYYQSVSLNTILDSSKSNQWQTISLFNRIPKVEPGTYEFAFYFWNQKEEFFLDDIELTFYSEE